MHEISTIKGDVCFAYSPITKSVILQFNTLKQILSQSFSFSDRTIFSNISLNKPECSFSNKHIIVDKCFLIDFIIESHI